MEGLSDDAHRTTLLAVAAARRLGHPEVGTEHLLLALLDDDGSVGDLLRAAGATPAAARHKVAEIQGAGTGAPAGAEPPYTARARRALDRAGRFSRQDRASNVTTRHVLMGVLDVEGLGCQVLRGLGVDLGQLRKSLDAGSQDAPERVPEPHDEPVLPECGRCGARLEETLTETLMTTRRADERGSLVSVVFCGACGATLGVLA